MSAPLTLAPEPNWGLAGAIAVVSHLVLGSAVLLSSAEATVPKPVPVMVVELPAGAAPTMPQPQEAAAVPEPVQPLPNMVSPRFDAPKVDAPLPPDPVTIPAPQPIPQRMVQPAPRPQPSVRPAPQAQQPSAPAVSTARSDTGVGAGDDPNAREAANDWYALISAHLERNKRYPREARSAGQQGTPTVRFSVDRRGRVTDVSISQSSGHELLDEATISLMRRVSPLPPMPRSMHRDSVTISLPIDYSLGRK